MTTSDPLRKGVKRERVDGRGGGWAAALLSANEDDAVVGSTEDRAERVSFGHYGGRVTFATVARLVHLGRRPQTRDGRALDRRCGEEVRGRLALAQGRRGRGGGGGVEEDLERRGVKGWGMGRRGLGLAVEDQLLPSRPTGEDVPMPSRTHSTRSPGWPWGKEGKKSGSRRTEIHGHGR